MNNLTLKVLASVTLTASLTILHGCSDTMTVAEESSNSNLDSSSSPVPESLPAEGPETLVVAESPATPAPSLEPQTPPPDQSFSFPDIASFTDTPSLEIPAGPIPSFSARRTITKGAGALIQFGDPVVLRYNLYSWRSGERIESSDELEEGVTVRAGVAEGVPRALAGALPGHRLGDTLQVVFEAGMDDLPEYLDNSDAYVIVVELL